MAAASTCFCRTRRGIATAALVTTVGVTGMITCLASTPALAETSPTACTITLSPGANLGGTVEDAPAGSTICLNAGTYGKSLGTWIESSRGTTGEPITVTSTDPKNPATILTLGVLEGANWITFTRLNFDVTSPKPWVCWNDEGNVVPGQIVMFPRNGRCQPGRPSPEELVQIIISGAHDSFTWDNITNNNTNICINVSDGQDTLIEHDRIYNCGPPVIPVSQGGTRSLNEEPGWHFHDVYDYGRNTVIKNNYIYNSSRDGVLLYGGGEGSVVEHNIIDHNGAGIWFGTNRNDVARWNIITNSTSPRGSLDDGIGSYEAGPGNVATKNCLYGNQSAEIDVTGVTVSENKTNTNPLYVNAAQHEYSLQSSSPCIGYGPDTAQPNAGVPTEIPTEPTPKEPPAEITPVKEVVPSGKPGLGEAHGGGGTGTAGPPPGQSSGRSGTPSNHPAPPGGSTNPSHSKSRSANATKHRRHRFHHRHRLRKKAAASTVHRSRHSHRGRRSASK
jgi:Right handed beta helix region